jgi:hypothetical protein
MASKKKNSKSKNLIKYIVLNFGYVESSYPFSWIFQHESDGFETKFEAAKSLALEYYNAYVDQHGDTQINECCLFALKESDKYCKSCGKKISVIEDDMSISEPYRDWLMEICDKNMNDCSVSEHFIYTSWLYNVSPIGLILTEENSLFIGEADKVLTGLLYDELKDYLNKDILMGVLGNTTFEKFKASFDKEEGPDIYGH